MKGTENPFPQAANFALQMLCTCNAVLAFLAASWTLPHNFGFKQSWRSLHLQNLLDWQSHLSANRYPSVDTETLSIINTYMKVYRDHDRSG